MTLLYGHLWNERKRYTLKLQKEVKPFGDAAHILVPKSWIGWEVQIKVRPKQKVKSQINLKTEKISISEE
jgi:putative transposon-encoded protein